MAKLHFDLVSPERALFAGEVDMVIAPGVEGDFGVLPGHAPLVSTLRAGILEIRNGAESNRMFVRGGFAEVNPTGLTVLAEEAVPVAELKAAQIEAELKAAEEELQFARTDLARVAAAERIETLRAKRAAIGG